MKVCNLCGAIFDDSASDDCPDCAINAQASQSRPIKTKSRNAEGYQAPSAAPYPGRSQYIPSNPVSIIFKIIGWLIIGFAIIAAVISGSSEQWQLYSFAIAAVGCISGIGFIGIGEIIKLLNIIANR
ncbi:MAG: hypothetical protein LBV27_07220 [Oscillospiraceae bacterium]|jgi:hypothetical protein|nr:hypothetical protein [Oscillospiraceae bacterium]